MKKRFWIIPYVLLCFPMILFLFPEQKLSDPVSVYKSAIAAFPADEDITLSIHSTKEIRIGNSKFHIASQKLVQCDIDENNNLMILSNEKLFCDHYETTITELFSDDQLYITLNNTKFKSSITKSAYVSSLLPKVILNEKLYNHITGIRNKTGCTISFSEPTALEDWITGQTPDSYYAEGNVSIDHNGKLTGFIYKADYIAADIYHCDTYSIEILTETPQIHVPEDTNKYMEIEEYQALYALETSSIYLIQADNIAAEYSDDIYIQATGDRRKKNVQSQILNTKGFSANMKTVIESTNDSQIDSIHKYATEEVYSDDKYTIATDGGTPLTDTKITFDAMQKYIHNQLISTIMLPIFVRNATVTNDDTYIRYNFIPSQDFAESLIKNACDNLYQDPSMLDNIVKDITTKEFHCYLTVNKRTGLPHDSGIVFSACYKISGIPYEIKYYAQQKYCF